MGRGMPEPMRPARRFLRTRKARRNALQIVVVTGLALLAGLLLRNLIANLSAQGIGIDFSFLLSRAGFDVNESLIAYDANDTYLSALLVGVLNTVHLTAVAIVLTTLLGVAVGLLSLSEIKVVRIMTRLYVECMRNLPKLLIVLTVYVFLVLHLPVAREAVSFLDIAYLSNRGLNLPAIKIDYALLAEPAGLLVAMLYFAGFCTAWLAVRGRTEGVFMRWWLPSLCLAAALFASTAAVRFEVPEFSGFNFTGGTVVSIPFLSLAIALSVYQAAQVGEVVRSGILAVPKGQLEAGRSLGLKRSHITWLIVFPQALRVIIPPLTNQYLNLLKNTSIGVAIGYSDVVSIMNTSINQTFRPVELMLFVMAIYLTIGLLVSLFLSIFNRRAQIRER